MCTYANRRDLGVHGRGLLQTCLFVASVEMCNTNLILEKNKFTISLSPPIRYRKLIMLISMSANKILNDSSLKGVTTRPTLLKQKTKQNHN